MIPFLKSVALAYVSRYSDLSDICFLFPNKRSGTFFLKYIKEGCGGKLMLSPEVMTITEFVAMLSGRVVASRIDQLFTLYEAYREMLGLPAWDCADEGLESDFDSFRTWGETVLSDFSEVDQYMADPDEIFKNVKDYREIATTFLTEEQRKVMAEYFGRNDTGDPSKFWKNFDGGDGDLSEVKRRFLYLWRIMAPLYHKLDEKLKKRGLATSGGSYRLAVETLRERGREMLPYKKIVAVGFNALSTAENAIFTEIRDFEGYEGYDAFGDFFWDATGPVLSSGLNSASKFVKSNISMFPVPGWALPALRLSDTTRLPRLKAVASPSNAGQVKIVGTILSELRSRLSATEITDARVAVVLPDENLLLPMLYSLPEGMGDVNLTMGYPLRLTSVVPFVSLLRRLQNGIRANKGEESGFYHKDLRLFLAHPFSHAVFGTVAVNKINGYLDRHHKSVMTLLELQEFNEEAARMLDVSNMGKNPAEILNYIDGVLSKVASALPSLEGAMVKTRLEISHIEVYRDALRRLSDIFEEYSVGMRPSAVFYLVDRLLAGEKVGFEGEPLTGLQVMGTLETRSIDFDHIMILSMNERIMPRRARSKSFIPDSLRHAFCMPPSNYAESIFSYYFYRMISRAKEVTLIYDARTGGGMSGGDVSRYVLQLRHLYAKGIMEEQDWRFMLSGKMPHDASVEKTDSIMEKIKEFEQEGKRNFSASSLNSYRECPVRFFYNNIIGITSDPEPSEFIDAITAGNVLHSIMMQLYLPEPLRGRMLPSPVVIDSTFLNKILEDKEKLWRITTQTINKYHFHRSADLLDTPLSGAARIVGERIMEQAVGVVCRDLRIVPFRLYGCEIAETLRIELTSGRMVNFRFAIDRLDEIEVEGNRQLRIVDYKTGRIKLDADSIDDVMGGGYSSEQIFQLFTYAWLLDRRGGMNPDSVRMEIYDVPSILKEEERLPVIGGEKIYDFSECREDFSAGIEQMIENIFSSEKFEATEDEERCSMCHLRILCGR